MVNNYREDRSRDLTAKDAKLTAKVAKKTNVHLVVFPPYILFPFSYGPTHGTCARSAVESCHCDCGGHHYWQRDLSGAGGDDAGCRVGQAGLSGLAGGR